jgi:SAM-dependent methyltransferase
MDADVDRYFSVVAAEWPDHDVGNLRFYLELLFDRVPLRGRAVLDVGAGDGIYSFFMACAGAERVVALEPEVEGSTPGVVEKLDRVSRALGLESVEVRRESLQEFDPDGRQFDVLFMHAVLNHLDEEACIDLHRDEGARQTYRELFRKLAGMSTPGADLVAVECSPQNLFARFGVKSPFAPTIEWHKHQPPERWAALLEQAGFGKPRIRWHGLNTLRRPGQLLLGNRLGAWFISSSFLLTMQRGPD